MTRSRRAWQQRRSDRPGIGDRTRLQAVLRLAWGAGCRRPCGPSSLVRLPAAVAGCRRWLRSWPGLAPAAGRPRLGWRFVPRPGSATPAMLAALAVSQR